MTVESRFMAKNPEHIVMEMKISMTLGEWMEVRNALWGCGIPTMALRDHITSLVRQGQKTFCPEGEEDVG